ncbi:MAG: L,D-transpeptidase [Pyrinomonadaceae bacterium]
MKRYHTYRTLILITFAAFIASGLMGCQTSPITTQQPVSVNSSNESNATNTNTNVANSNSAASTAGNANLPVTMPVIDAMFSDETFAQAAQSEARLTEEEVGKIRDAARNSVLQMNGEQSEDENRSTRSATDTTKKEIEKLVGPEKAAGFISFVQTRWAGDTTELSTAQPNSVPSDTRIVVNSPAYRMDLFRDGKLVKSYKVGIGYPEFPLPTGLRYAKEIIFNPTWTPPDEPWVKGKFQPGKKVEAGSKLNPLGPIKIPIGYPSLIHGGKDPSRLGNFASHGCVGLTNPMVQDIAVEIASIGGAAVSTADVKEFAKKKDETKNVKIPNPVPVELRYETIVVEDGKVHVFRDVYERGTNTEENLRKVLAAFDVSFDELPEADKSKLRDAILRMAVDAQGNMVTGNVNSNAANNNSGKVTKNIKGVKEVVVDIAALSGKGYPAPVALVQK